MTLAVRSHKGSTEAEYVNTNTKMTEGAVKPENPIKLDNHVGYARNNDSNDNDNKCNDDNTSNNNNSIKTEPPSRKRIQTNAQFNNAESGATTTAYNDICQYKHPWEHCRQNIDYAFFNNQ